MYNWFTWLSTWNKHIINQLYFNKIFLEKRRTHHSTPSSRVTQSTQRRAAPPSKEHSSERSAHPATATWRAMPWYRHQVQLHAITHTHLETVLAKHPWLDTGQGAPPVFSHLNLILKEVWNDTPTPFSTKGNTAESLASCWAVSSWQSWGFEQRLLVAGVSSRHVSACGSQPLIIADRLVMWKTAHF